MTKDVLIEKVCTILVDEFEMEQDKLVPAARLKEDLGIDSLDFVDIVVAIEREFGFKPDASELKQVKTLDELYAYIEKQL